MRSACDEWGGCWYCRLTRPVTSETGLWLLPLALREGGRLDDGDATLEGEWWALFGSTIGEECEDAYCRFGGAASGGVDKLAG